MKAHRPILALLALVSLAIYVLACRSSFSPDGSKILVTAAGGANEQGHVLMYDRKEAKWSHLFSTSRSHKGDGICIPTTTWSPDGKEILALWVVGDERIMVSTLPVGGDGPTRLFELEAKDGQKDDLIAYAAVPPVRHGQFLLFGGGSLTVLDLQSGKVERQPLPGAGDTNAPRKTIWLTEAEKQVHYLITGGAQAEAGRLDIGDITAIRFQRMIETPASIIPSVQNAFLAVSKAASRVALTVGDGSAQSLLIYRQLQLERVLPFGAATNAGVILGNLAWSPDGRTLYATGFKSLQPGAFAKAISAGFDKLNSLGFNIDAPRTLDFEVLLCEIPMDGRPMRETPVFRMAISSGEPFAFLYQLALSPDGATVALSDGFAEIHEESKRPRLALYLVDVSGSRRPVSRIPIPKNIVKAAGLMPE